jgi:hypothetical protein
LQWSSPRRAVQKDLVTIPPDKNAAAAIAVDMMDNASALPTCPQRKQQQKTAIPKWFKITHTTSRRGFFWLCVPKIRFCNIGGEGRRGQAVM